MSKLLESTHPVVFFGNGVGDHLLNLPSLRALAKLFPNRLRLVCMPGAAATYFSDIPFGDVLETEMNWTGNRHKFDAGALSMRIGPCDLFLSLVPWHSKSMDQLLGIVAPAHSIGFFAGFHDVLQPDYSKHSADLAFELPRRLDPTLRLEAFAAPPALAARPARLALEIRHAVPPGMRVLAIHADTNSEKMWPVKRWCTFLDFILDCAESLCVLVVGRVPLRLDRVRHSEHVVLCYGLSITESFALVALADFFVGVDSCMLHAADLFRTPGVGLFAPTNAKEFGFRLAPHRHVVGRKTMDSIAVHQVVQAFHDLIRELETRRASSIRSQVKSSSRQSASIRRQARGQPRLES